MFFLARIRWIACAFSFTFIGAPYFALESCWTDATILLYSSKRFRMWSIAGERKVLAKLMQKFYSRLGHEGGGCYGKKFWRVFESPAGEPSFDVAPGRRAGARL